MDVSETSTPRRREIALEGRGPGYSAVLDFGPAQRPVDIVFLNANGFNAMTYRGVLAPLAADLRILIADQRGHGATTLSTEREGRTTWLDLRDDLVALMRALELTQVVMSGHSMGGTASLLAAAEDASFARSLVLFEPVILPPGAGQGIELEALKQSPLVQGALRRRSVFPSRAAALEAYRGRGAFKTWPEESIADYVAGGFRDRPDGEVELACDPLWEVSNYTSQAHDSWAAFERLTCPIRIFRAEHASTGRLDSLATSGRVRVETIPGTTHFLPIERPDLVRSALREAVEA